MSQPEAFLAAVEDQRHDEILLIVEMADEAREEEAGTIGEPADGTVPGDAADGAADGSTDGQPDSSDSSDGSDGAKA